MSKFGTQNPLEMNHLNRKPVNLGVPHFDTSELGQISKGKNMRFKRTRNCWIRSIQHHETTTFAALSLMWPHIPMSSLKVAMISGCDTFLTLKIQRSNKQVSFPSISPSSLKFICPIQVFLGRWAHNGLQVANLGAGIYWHRNNWKTRLKKINTPPNNKMINVK